MPLADPKRWAEQLDRPGHPSPPEEGPAPRAQGQPLRRHHAAYRVALGLGRPAQALPTLPEEPEDLVQAARARQAQANGTAEDLLSHPEVVAVTVALQVGRSHPIALVPFVGGPRLRARPLLAGQQRGEADPRRAEAVALPDALDGARARERADAQPLEFGADGRAPVSP